MAPDHPDETLVQQLPVEIPGRVSLPCCRLFSGDIIASMVPERIFRCRSLLLASRSRMPLTITTRTRMSPRFRSLAEARRAASTPRITLQPSKTSGLRYPARRPRLQRNPVVPPQYPIAARQPSANGQRKKHPTRRDGFRRPAVAELVPATPERGSSALALVAAVALATVAAYFSVTGMAEIFPGAPVAIMLLAATMEAGKLVMAGWLAAHWRRVGWKMRSVMVALVTGLALINAAGVFGSWSRPMSAWRRRRVQASPNASMRSTLASPRNRLSLPTSATGWRKSIARWTNRRGAAG